MGVRVGKVHPSLTFCQNFMTNGQLEADLLLYKGQCVYSIGRKMNFGQRANIKFCLKLGKTFTERFELIKQVYGDNGLFRARVHEWFKRFKEGGEDIKDEEHPGQESFVITPSNIEIVREFMKTEPKSSLRHMAMELNMSKDSIHRILTENSPCEAAIP